MKHSLQNFRQVVVEHIENKTGVRINTHALSDSVDALCYLAGYLELPTEIELQTIGLIAKAYLAECKKLSTNPLAKNLKTSAEMIRELEIPETMLGRVNIDDVIALIERCNNGKLAFFETSKDEMFVTAGFGMPCAIKVVSSAFLDYKELNPDNYEKCVWFAINFAKDAFKINNRYAPSLYRDAYGALYEQYERDIQTLDATPEWERRFLDWWSYGLEEDAVSE